MSWDDIDGIDGMRTRPAPPDEAVDAVIAIGWDEGGLPRQPRGWGVVYGMPNGTLRIERGLDFREVRRIVGFQWELMTDEVAAGRRYGVRQMRSDTWVMTQRCSDGVTRVFTAKDRSARQVRVRPVLPVATQVRGAGAGPVPVSVLWRRPGGRTPPRRPRPSEVQGRVGRYRQPRDRMRELQHGQARPRGRPGPLRDLL